MKYHNGYPIIGDDSPTVSAEGHGTGYEPRDYEAWPLNGQEHNRASTIERLDEQVIRELIEEKTAKKTWVTDLADRVGSKVKDQQNSSYCWIHAPVRGMEYARIHEGGPVLTLSAFYAGSQIKNGRNQGGSGVTGVNWLVKHGTCKEEMWLPMKFKGQVTPEIEENAGLHQIKIAEEIEADDYQMIWSSVVQDHPVTVGIPDWGHEVLLTFLALVGRDINEGFDNSWKYTWGNNGRGVLSGRKRRFDEAMRIAAMEQSAA